MKKYSIVFLILSIVFAQSTIPNAKVRLLNNETIDLHELTGDVSFVSFWATWCVPCINELDAISEIYQDWQDETNVEVIAISTDDARTRRRVKPLINGKDWEFKIYVDENQDLKRALNINILPYVIVVKDGKIIHTRTGYTPGSEEELFEIVKQHTD